MDASGIKPDTVPAGMGPAHVWVTGAFGLVWSALAAHDDLLLLLRDTDYLASLPAQKVAFLDALASWVGISQSVGVWAALAGCLLILLRQNLAVQALAVSLAGQLAFVVDAYFLHEGFRFLGGAPAALLAGVNCLVTLALMAYATFLSRRRVLR